jgi:hypothetical protein
MTFSAFTTVAGNGKAGYSGDGGPASEGQFSEPHDVGVDTDGNLYIPDYGNNRIRKVTKEGVISTVVGNAYVVTARMVARPPLPNSLDREVWPWIPPETTRDEKDRLLFAAKEARSPVIYPALMLALNAGMRDAEIRNMQWLRLDLSKCSNTIRTLAWRRSGEPWKLSFRRSQRGKRRRSIRYRQCRNCARSKNGCQKIPPK